MRNQFVCAGRFAVDWEAGMSMRLAGGGSFAIGLGAGVNKVVGACSFAVPREAGKNMRTVGGGSFANGWEAGVTRLSVPTVLRLLGRQG